MCFELQKDCNPVKENVLDILVFEINETYANYINILNFLSFTDKEDYDKYRKEKSFRVYGDFVEIRARLLETIKSDVKFFIFYNFISNLIIEYVEKIYVIFLEKLKESKQHSCFLKNGNRVDVDN
ncbi:hypothetical protein COBT_003369, partial [Conglomerata obtusa]